MRNIDSSYVSTLPANPAILWRHGKPLLQHLDIELTERCNNNCIHCYINLPAGDQEAQASEIPASTIKRLLTDAATLGALSVRFTGGEPMLRSDFDDIYLHARHLGLAVLIFTNACLISPKLADLFARVPPLRKIEVTAYGLRQQSYEAATRTSGSYARFRRGIALLLERGVPFVVKGTVLPPNKREIAEFDAWAQTLPWAQGQPGYSMFYDCRGRRDSKCRNLEICDLRVSPEMGIAILSRKRDLYLEEMRRFCKRLTGPPGDRIFACGAGTTPCVDAYGYLQPCVLLRHPDTVYSLSSGSLGEALADFFPHLHGRRATNLEYLSRCSRCFLSGLCEQCPAKSWAEHGSLDTPVEYLCTIAHTQARDVGLLDKGERAWEVIGWKERVQSFVDSIM